MNNMVTKLSSVAALLGVVGAIGAGFVQYGKVMAKIDELDNRKAVINETVDLSPLEERISVLEVDVIDRINEVEEQIKPVDLTLVFKEIGKVREQIAMLPEPADLQPILNQLQMLEEYGWEIEEDLEELSKQTAIVSKENELQDIQIKEIKKKADNPLAK